MRSIEKSKPFPSTKTTLDGLIDEFFNRSLSNVIGSDSDFPYMPVNVSETQDAVRVHLAAPGFDKTDLSVEVEGDQLIIRGKKEVAADAASLRYKRREFQVNSFVRTFVLPEGTDAESVNAHYLNGVLEIALPKKEEAKPVVRSIQIEG